MNKLQVQAISPLVGPDGLVGIIVMDSKGDMTLLEGPAVGMIMSMGNGNGMGAKRGPYKKQQAQPHPNTPSRYVVKPLACPECDWTTSSPRELRKHEAKEHQIYLRVPKHMKGKTK